MQRPVDAGDVDADVADLPVHRCDGEGIEHVGIGVVGQYIAADRVRSCVLRDRFAIRHRDRSVVDRGDGEVDGGGGRCRRRRQ